MRDDVGVLRERAMGRLRALGFYDHADDGAQHIALKYLENPDSKQTIDQAVIDYLRKTFGRPDRPGPRLNEGNEVKYGCMDDHAQTPAHELEPDRLLERLNRTHLKPQERASLVLFFRWGFSCREIGQLFGTTEAGASQYITAALLKLGVNRTATQIRADVYPKEKACTEP